MAALSSPRDRAGGGESRLAQEGALAAPDTEREGGGNVSAVSDAESEAGAGVALNAEGTGGEDMPKGE